MSKTIALIMAAGIGSRIASETPKQYLKINGQSILRLAIEQFAQHQQIDAIACVIHRDHEHLYYDALRASQSTPKLLAPIIGGHERQDSVRLGLNALKTIQPQYVLIHDAARIFVSHISQVIQSLPIYDAVVLGIRTRDTLWQETETEISPISRSNVFQIQTPQAFRYDFICSLHHKYKDKTFTDDLGLVVHDSPHHKIKIIESSEALIKRPFSRLAHEEQRLEDEREKEAS
jgi:2-C-methyl-D-erythritol 4-phosphate cytidylyltransferase